MYVEPRNARNSSANSGASRRDGANSPGKSPPKRVILHREVLPPPTPNTGVGVILVAAASMFFAVASSAFVLRTQHKTTHIHSKAPMGAISPDTNQQHTHAIPEKVFPMNRRGEILQTISADATDENIEINSVTVTDSNLSEEGLEICGTPTIHKLADRRTDVLFRLCPNR